MSEVERIDRQLRLASGKALDRQCEPGDATCQDDDFDELEPDHWQPVGAVARLVVNGLRKVTP